ncbi:MAG: hypothetical protein ACOYNK_06490, partial [Microbacteriaceae bacterium]
MAHTGWSRCQPRFRSFRAVEALTRRHRGPFHWGDRVQLTDAKGRHTTVSLVPGGEV